MLIETERALVLVDTTWTAEEASALLGFIDEQLKRPVTSAVITHFHGDRTGGLTAVLDRGIPVQSTARTAELLPPALAARVHAQNLAVGEVLTSSDDYELFYPGAGHSVDNVVVWFPKQQLLFGGCLVKDENASSLGNVADADLAAWPLAVQRVAARYPQAHFVVPGHGDAGDPQALAHTLELLTASK
jgi:glyoxylase-like metal-dependent hydrolase (beta-lactamase superfamily II)